MSFYRNRANTENRQARPGPIQNNATDGLQNRVCISVKRVLDSSMKQINQERVKLPLKVENDAHRLFKACTSVGQEAVVTDLTIVRLEQRDIFARIRCNIIVPMQVTYVDVDGETQTEPSEIRVHQDIVMYVPEASVFPFEIVAVASCNASSGEFKEDGLYVNACMTIITKVVASTDLLVPAYGYCPVPEAVNFEEQACNNFFELPLYPK